MTYVLPALLGALIVLACWLLWPGAGLGLVWKGAPGGELAFRLRLRSPLAWLLKLGRVHRGPTGEPINSGVTVFGVVHIRYGSVSPSLLAHEVGHACRARGQQLRYLWRYLTSSHFREDEEAACWEFSRTYATDPFLADKANRIRKG